MIAKEYGSRRGFAGTSWHRLLYTLGFYRRYRRIDWHRVERLVFVCKGNICRSPFAEAVARSLDVDAVSCGLDTVVGSPANVEAAKAARRLGFSLENHGSRPINQLQLRETDLLIAMEPGQAEALDSAPLADCSRTLLGLWFTPAFPYIQDPYGMSSEYFDVCFGRIEESVNAIAQKVKKQDN